MTRRQLHRICEMLAVIAEAADDGPEQISHEVAHAVLLYGRMRYCVEAPTDSRIDKMSISRANEHEIKTLALQVAGMRALGHPVRLAKAVDASWSSFREPRRKYVTQAEVRRAVIATTPSKRGVRQFVRAFRAMEVVL